MMNILKVNYSEVPFISKRDLAYISEDQVLRPFYKYEFAKSALKQVISDRKNFPVDRSLLSATLSEQYSNIAASDKTKANIEALKNENCFTIITAHQPSLLTGPLYFIYKICSTINLCKQLNTDFPEYQFVPVFVSGGEDHDFEEINHLQLYGKQISWQSEQTGSVGRMNIEGLAEVVAEVKGILGDSGHAPEIMDIFEKSLSSAKVYFDFVFSYVNELFRSYGLVIANMDHHALKQAFIPHIKKEILEQQSQAYVEQASKEIEAVGFKSQATARPINFFYMKDDIRERIVKEGVQYQVLNTNIQFSEAEMLAEIENHPDRFSPNVVMRPIYQEVIMPNLAYIGGGGELAYWMERQAQFKAFGAFYPMLIRRNSVQWVDARNIKQQNKLGFDSLSLLKDEQSLINNFVELNAEAKLDISAELAKIEEAFDGIAAQAKEIEAPLEKYVLAEKAKQLKMVGHVERKLSKAIKQKHDVSINKIKSVKAKLFPSNSLQERKNNFLPQYAKHGKSYIELLVDNLDPFDKHYLIIEEKD